MKRRLLNLLTLLSLLLCVAVVALWVRSYWRCEWFEIGNATRSRIVGSSFGSIYAAAWPNNARIYGWDVHSSDQVSLTIRGDGVVMPYSSGGAVIMGLNQSIYRFERFLFGTGAGGDDIAVVVPHWFPAALTLALPAALCIRRRHEYRNGMQGLCPKCRYDLRATPDRCPECGARPW